MVSGPPPLDGVISNPAPQCSGGSPCALIKPEDRVRLAQGEETDRAWKGLVKVDNRPCEEFEDDGDDGDRC